MNTHRPRLPAAIRALRPKQWLKNVLVFAAPLAAGRITEPAVALDTALAAVAFALVSSTIYLINDINDIAEDRAHPRKRFRPIAAGELSVRTAWILAVILGVASLALSAWLAWWLLVVIAVYLVLQLCYSSFLKHEPIIDLAIVASGFLLRTVAGGVATGIELSQWFLLVASFGSLFMVSGKRYSEHVQLGTEAGTRKSLARYSAPYLRFVWTLSAACTVMSYGLWAFQYRGLGPGQVQWTALSLAPFTLALMRYALTIDQGKAGEPEDIVLSDHLLQVLGGIWFVLVVVAVMW